MLNRLFLLPPLRAKLLPLETLLPNLPSLPFLSRAFRNNSLVDGRRSLAGVCTFNKFWSTISAVFEPPPLLLCMDFFEAESAVLTLAVDAAGFLFKISDVEERRGEGAIDKYGDGLTHRGMYSRYCNNGVVDVVGVAIGVVDADDDDGYRCGDCG